METTFTARPSPRWRPMPPVAIGIFASIAALWMAILPFGGAQASMVVPNTIPADCSQDVSADLNAFFDSVPDGTTVTFPTEACYLVVSTVTVQSKTDVTVVGNGTRLVRTELSPQELRYPNRNGYFRITDGTRVRMSGLHVEGTNSGDDYGGTILDADGNERTVDCLTHVTGYGCYTPALEFEHAFEVLGSVDTVVENMTAKNVWGDGVYVVGHDQFTSQRGNGVTVRNVSVDRNGRQGIAVARISNVLIDGFNLAHGRRSGVDLEPDTSSELIENIEIRNSTIETNLLAFASYGRGEVSRVYIHHNTITRTGVPWVYVRANDGTRRYDWRVHSNDVQYGLASPQPGLLFDNVQDVDVRGNTNHYSTGYPTDAVGLFNGSTAHVACNWFENAREVVSDRDGTSSWTEENNSTSGNPPSNCETETTDAEPTVDITAPAEGTTLAEGTAIDLSATADDAEDGDLTASVEWASDLDGALGTGGTVTAELSVGSHTITASVTDSTGATATATVGVVVEPGTNDPPEVSITEPTDGTSVEGETTITCEGTATDGEDGDLSDKISWSSDIDGDLGKGASVTSALSPGTHTIVAAAVDSEGASSSAAVTVTVDEAPAVVSLAEIHLSTHGGKGGFRHLLANSRLVDGSGLAVSDVPLTLELTLDGELFETVDAVTGDDGTVEFRWNNAPAGSYVATVVRVDHPYWDGVTLSDELSKD